MKRFSFITLGVLTLTCVNCNALTITKGHLTSHKEWTTGEAKAVFKESKLTSTTRSYQNSYISAGIQKQSGKLNEIVDVSGSGNLYVYNNTESTQQYTVEYSICAIDHRIDHCAFYQDIFELEQYGYASTAISTILQHMFKEPGEYTVYARTYLNSRYGDSQYHISSDSSSASSITIS